VTLHTKFSSLYLGIRPAACVNPCSVSVKVVILKALPFGVKIEISRMDSRSMSFRDIKRSEEEEASTSGQYFRLRIYVFFKPVPNNKSG
jgi:hypothetical protein